MENDKQILRGELYYADLQDESVTGSEQHGIRPVLVVQNNVGNKYSPTIIVTALTSQHKKKTLPTHVFIKAGESGLKKDSYVLLEQVKTIDKKRLCGKIGQLSINSMAAVNLALLISLDYISPQYDVSMLKNLLSNMHVA